MNRWQCIGASVIGPAHIRNNLPNQDAWLYHHEENCDCAVVADGLGSKHKSDLAAAGICKAVVSAADWQRQKAETQFNPEAFILKAMMFFDEEVKGLSRKDCATTCLICLRLKDKIYLAMLGDGLLAALLKSGEIIRLEDDKSESFSNMVSALVPDIIETDWLFRELSEADCKAVILCTDGVSDDLADINGFITEFVETIAFLPKEAAEHDIQKMLESWPVLRHSDDKTIVCFFCDEVTNE